MNAARVLLVNYEYPPLGGGAGTATAALARALVDLGCDVVVLTSRFRGQPGEETVDGYRVQRIRVMRRHADRCSPLEMITFIVSSMAAVLRLQWRPHVSIAFFGIPGGPAAWLLRVVRGVPYIVSLRGGDVPGFTWAPGTHIYHSMTAPVIRFIWRRARAVVANGTGLRDLAQRAAPGLSVPVIPNGVDTERHDPRGALPKPAGAPPRILLLGRLVHQKGGDTLLRALATMPEVPFELEFAGDGPERPALDALARTLGLADRVHFAGWVPREELSRHYNAADVFAFPSRIEGMPNVVLEAMAYALPVIVTDVPGNSDLVEHERTGIVIEPESVEQLAAGLRRLLGDAALRRRLGDAAREHVRTAHSWRSSALAYLELAGIPAAESSATTAARQGSDG